ncbi:MAG: hypothetical protein LUF30_11045 [Lachnospiraceae bacterium]|nr:hypothetical protein [Lachnospiraceae bacterium]
MSLKESFDKLVSRFDTYYDVRREDVEPPFEAEAVFHSHDEQYFLVRSAAISEAESHEYVYFAMRETLDANALQMMDSAAWERGLAQVTPHKDHRNSDVTLIILADKISDEAMRQIPKLHHYKSYRFSLQGWSQYRLIALEQTSGRVAYNRQGADLKKLVSNIS